jgi:hypothetical protein
VVLVLILLGACGLRLLWDRRVAASMVESVRLPFTSFPPGIAGPEWKEQDVPLREVERSTIGVTDYLQRRYTRGDQEIWLYAGFIAGRSRGTIHPPEYCLPASGYELQETDSITLDVPGFPQPTRWKENLWRDARGAPVYCLHTLYYNGSFEPEDWRLRTARVLGVPYFVTLNVMGAYTGSLEETRSHYRGLLETAVPLLVRHLP